VQVMPMQWVPSQIPTRSCCATATSCKSAAGTWLHARAQPKC
jgi:hypothetical protein